MSKFFIDHPIFANVIAILTVILGLVALWVLPVEQYPPITPPTVRVTTVYPGADAQVVANTVASPIEQQVNGVEGMMYMSSTSSSDGSYTLTVTFEIGTDLDLAQVLVQNRVAIAEPTLPEEVRRQGLSVRKQTSNIVLSVALTSPEGTYDELFLSNFATLRLRDELSRVAGVGDVNVSGAGAYAMRIWLDPERMRARQLTTTDIIAVLNEQNVQVAAGRVGQPPTDGKQQFQYTVTTLGRLSEPSQFADIVVKTGENGRITYLRDVATIELGAQVYDQFSRLSGKPSANVLIYQLPGSNALDVSKGVRAAMERLARTFPDDVAYTIPFDTTKFVNASVEAVYHTLFEAGVLVLIVILVFLQDWRAVLVPTTTVPVTIVGAFAFMYALGFSVNLLTLFGLILAIGIVVDDAIVIVENAAHHIERGEPPRLATIRAMREVTGPVIGITLVLLAVFLPAAFMGGITGQLYRQFALTIAATALISAVNALTLKPAQCATYLRPPKEKKNVFARGFNHVYGYVERAYTWLVRQTLRVIPLGLAAYVALLALTGWWYSSLPTSFMPTEDQGYLIVNVQLPDAASLDRTLAVVDHIDGILQKSPGVDNWFVLGGYSLLDGAASSNAATIFVILKDWEERETPELSQNAILAHFRREFYNIQEAIVFTLVPPPIQGLGVGGGFQMQIEDQGDVGLAELQYYVQAIIAEANKSPEIGGVNSTFRSEVPQIYVDVNRVKVKRTDVPLADVFATLQGMLGSTYVNDFNKFGRTYQVRLQAEAKFRESADEIARLQVRNRQGQMVPIGTLATIERTTGPQIISRYNLFPTAAINGAAAPGYSSGQALAKMEQIAREQLPQSMGYEWTAVAYQEQRVGGQAYIVFAMATLLVYFVLAAQYESWFLPLAVILVVPLGILGGAIAVSAKGFDNNIYTQIGVVLIIALASKNAILIVEFARELRLAGRSITEAAIEAAQLRFRPILMTSFAFILGVVPLVFATGAAAASRQSLGAVVFGGMISSTILAVFFVPLFYVVIQWLDEKWSGPPKRPDAEGEAHPPTPPEGSSPEPHAA
jgi:HAE1 family hydrophobic/amphiphilic exporter-1